MKQALEWLGGQGKKRARLSGHGGDRDLFVRFKSELLSKLPRVSVGVIHQLALLGTAVGNKYAELFPSEVDWAGFLLLAEKFELDNPLFACEVDELALEAFVRRRRENTSWEDVAGELGVDRHELLKRLLGAWRLGMQPELLRGSGKAFNDAPLAMLHELRELELAHSVYWNSTQLVARDNSSSSFGSSVLLPPVAIIQPCELNGELALQTAKQCLHFPLPDSLAYYSLAQGFFQALFRDPGKVGLLAQVVSGLGSTGQSADLVKLKAFLTRLVRQAPELLETLSAIPHCHLDHVFQEYLQGTGEFVVDRQTMGRILGLIGPLRVLDMLLSVPVAANTRAKYLLQELEDANKLDFCQLCCRQFNLALKPPSNGGGASHNATVMGEEDGEDDHGLLSKLEQLMVNFGAEAYQAEFLAKLELHSAKEFKRLIRACLDQNCATNPVWALKLQIKLVNASAFRQMQCRAQFVTKASARIQAEDTLENQLGLQAEEFIQEFEILSELPPGLLHLKETRSDHLKRTVLPLLTSSAGLVTALKQRFPDLFVEDPAPTVVVEELCGCEEIVDRICAAPNINLRLLSSEAFDALCKNLVTFGMINQGSSHRLNFFLVKLFLGAGNKFDHERTKRLAGVVFTNISDELLQKGLVRQALLSWLEPIHHLLGPLPPALLANLADLFVRESAERLTIESGVAVLHLFAMLAQHYPESWPKRNGSLAWLRQRLSPWQSEAWCAPEFDLFDAFCSSFLLPSDDGDCFPVLDAFIELEFSCRFAANRPSSALCIAQTALRG
ncbi:hypothetical protein BASA81_008542 [Batrachochytrium salamandrivorans]|nr:hypothetical protein BASA81_008542 [Batrachochytrium salamandrivorans]